MRRRPVLVLSLPRSGSSWVGAVLATARGTEHRNEVMTQRLLRDDGDAFRHVEPGAVDAAVAAAAADAFRRSWRRPVVKEVLPLLGSWLAARHDPVLVDLRRHPVAIAASHERLGWRAAPRERDRVPGEPGRRLREVWDDLGPWGRKVAYVAAVRRHVAATWGAGAVRVRYEDLRSDPRGRFDRLRTDVGLGPVRLDVGDRGPAAGPYALTRRPSSYPPAQATGELRGVWDHFDPDCYRDDADWR